MSGRQDVAKPVVLLTYTMLTGTASAIARGDERTTVTFNKAWIGQSNFPWSIAYARRQQGQPARGANGIMGDILQNSYGLIATAQPCRYTVTFDNDDSQAREIDYGKATVLIGLQNAQDRHQLSNVRVYQTAAPSKNPRGTREWFARIMEGNAAAVTAAGRGTTLATAVLAKSNYNYWHRSAVGPGKGLHKQLLKQKHSAVNTAVHMMGPRALAFRTTPPKANAMRKA